MQRNNEFRHVVFILVAVSFLALGGIFVRLSILPPVSTGFYRMLIALPVLYPLAISKVRKLSQKTVRKILLAGAFLGADLVIYNISFSYTSVANTTLLANLVIFTVVPVSFFIFKEKIPAKFLLSTLVTIGGVVILLSGKANPTGLSFLGDAMAIVASLFYAGYILMVYRLRDNVDVLSIMLLSSIGAGAVLLVAMLALEGVHIPMSLSALYPLLGLALLSQVCGQGLLSYALGKVTASLSSILVLTQPVIAALYAFALFHEALTLMEISGILIISFGIYLAKTSS